jgi:hypothetical protein
MPKDGAVDVCSDSASPYPGSEASVRELLCLADAYRTAAMELFDRAKGAGALAQAPARFCAIHAVELYLNAFLRHRGATPGEVRAKLHALDDGSFAAALDLKDRTRRHLSWMTANREYLISRYAPELLKTQSEVNRVAATMNEIAKKARRFLNN